MNKIRIAICDDEVIFLENLKKIICGIDEYSKKFEIDIYINSNDLLHSLNEYDVYFLDINMPNINGILLGKKLKSQFPKCEVIMETSSEDRYKDAFRIGALRYITKPYDVGEIKEALDTIVSKVRMSSKTLELFYQRNAFEIGIDRIKYVRAIGGYTEYKVEDRVFRKDISISDAEKFLEDRIFFRIHRQYIVNFSFIDEYKDGVIKIDNVILPVSKRNKKEFERAYIKYDLS